MFKNIKSLIKKEIPLIIAVLIFGGYGIVKAVPAVNILGNYAVVGTGLTATTSQNANFTASGTIQFPSLPSNNDCVITDSNGVLSTSSCGGLSIGGSTTNVQYNNGGTLGGDSNFTWSSSGQALAISGSAQANYLIVTSTNTTSTFASGIRFTVDNRCLSGPTWLRTHICFDEAGGIHVGWDSGTADTHTTWTGANIQEVIAGSEIGRWTANGLGIATTTPQSSLVIGASGGFAVNSSGVITAGTWNGSAIDISSYTNLAAGRSLTLSGDSVEADEETYAIEIGGTYLNASTSLPIKKQVKNAITLTYFYCATSGVNITLGADERASSTPASAGTDIFSGGSVTCDSDGFTTTTFSNAGIAAEGIINFDIDSVANATTSLFFNFYGTRDD